MTIVRKAVTISIIDQKCRPLSALAKQGLLDYIERDKR